MRRDDHTSTPVSQLLPLCSYGLQRRENLYLSGCLGCKGQGSAEVSQSEMGLVLYLPRGPG